MGTETLVLGEDGAALGQRIKTSAAEDEAYRTTLQEIVHGYGRLNLSEATGGDDVGRPQGEITEGKGGPLAQQDGPGVAYPCQDLEGILDG